MYTNRVTLSTLTFSSKPTEEETRKLKQKRYAVVQEVTVFELGELLTKGGHSMHPAVLNLEKDKREANPHTIKDRSAVSQDVFALDIDHGNYTVDDLLALSVVSPNLIYETHSSKPGAKRYRMIYFASESVDASFIRMVNQCLSSPLFKGLPSHLKEHVDIRCINESRIFYNGASVQYLDETSRFSPIALLQNSALLHESEQAFETIKQANSARTKRKFAVKKAWEHRLITDEEWELFLHYHDDKQVKESEEAWLYTTQLAQKVGHLQQVSSVATPSSSSVESTKDASPVVSPAPVETNQDPIHLTSLDAQTLALKLLEALADYPKSNLPTILDKRDAFDFVSGLPLHQLLGVELNQSFRCVLHEEEHPSASIYRGEKDDHYLYNCYGCLEKPLRVEAFFQHVFYEAYGHDVWQTITTVIGAMGIQLGSEYQEQKSREIEGWIDYYLQLPDDHFFVTLMGRTYLSGFYLAYLGVAKLSLPFTPVTKDERHGFFASMDTLLSHCLRRGVVGAKSISGISYKLNYLTYLGLIQKIEHRDLKRGFLKKSLSVAQVQREQVQGATPKGGKTPPRHLVSYYELVPLTVEVMEEALRRYQLYRQSGAKKRSFCAAQVTSIHDATFSQSVFVQSQVELKGKDALFLKLALKQSESLLSTQGYWDEKTLCRLIDKKGNHWKSSDKQRLLGKVLPTLLKTHSLTKRCVGKALREEYQLPTKIKTHSYIYTQERVTTPQD